MWFRNIAGEIVLPFKKQISDATQRRQFARTPFSCAFQSGWFKFILSTDHIYFGESSKSSAGYKRRVKEIESIAKFLKQRADKEKDNYILVGDFNIDKIKDTAYNALEKQGFEVFQNHIGSNAKQANFYDQISWLPHDSELQKIEEEKSQGVFNVFKAAFRGSDFVQYRSVVTQTLQGKLDKSKERLKEAREGVNKKRIQAAAKAVDVLTAFIADPQAVERYYLNTWRTFQISGYLPLWVELEIDFSSAYLKSLKNKQRFENGARGLTRPDG